MMFCRAHHVAPLPSRNLGVPTMWVLLVVVVVAVLWVIGAYNGLISLKNQTINAFKQIDVQLKRRHDLIPNLVNSVKGAMDFERSTLEAVIQARNQAVKVNASGPEGIKQISQAENALSGALSRLLVTVERYPELKETGNIGQLQEELSSTENRIGLVLTTVAIFTAWHTYKTGPEKVLWATGAHELIDPQTDAERQVANVVDEMAIAAGIPRPRIWIIPDEDPNAFATGHDPRDSHIAVTRGLLRICNRDELQAVIAHELGHVKNLDVRLMTTLAALVGAVLLVRDGMGRTMRGGGIPLRGARKGKSAGPLLAILLALWVISWILAPLVTQLLALAVSRRREYLADAMSAQFTRNPLALASALEKIEGAAAPTASIKSGAAHLCICDPLGRRLTNSEGWLADRFATHPPMSMRISRLKGMGYAQLKKEGGSFTSSALG